MDASRAENRADCQGDGQKRDGEKDGQQIDRGAEFWIEVEYRETEDVAQAKRGDEGGAADVFELVTKAKAVGDVDRKIVRAAGVPTSRSEQGIPGAERGDSALDSH